LIVDVAELGIAITGFGSNSSGIDDQEQHRGKGKCDGEIFSHALFLQLALIFMAA